MSQVGTSSCQTAQLIMSQRSPPLLEVWATVQDTQNTSHKGTSRTSASRCHTRGAISAFWYDAAANARCLWWADFVVSQTKTRWLFGARISGSATRATISRLKHKTRGRYWAFYLSARESRGEGGKKNCTLQSFVPTVWFQQWPAGKFLSDNFFTRIRQLRRISCNFPLVHLQLAAQYLPLDSVCRLYFGIVSSAHCIKANVARWESDTAGEWWISGNRRGGLGQVFASGSFVLRLGWARTDPIRISLDSGQAAGGGGCMRTFLLPETGAINLSLSVSMAFWIPRRDAKVLGS